MDCPVPSTWYEAKQSCQKVAKGRHPIEQVLVLAYGSCKLATCSHPVQGHNGAAIRTHEPSNCKPPAMKGLHMFASAHPGRPFMIACHESGTLVWGWSRMYVYTLIMSASAHASFKGMLVNSSLSENLNYKPNMSHKVHFNIKTIPKEQIGEQMKNHEPKEKGARFFGYFGCVLVCMFCVPKLIEHMFLYQRKV